MLQHRLLVWGAVCTLISPVAQAASIPAKAISRPVDRTDFANRVWFADFTTPTNWPGKLSTVQLKGKNSDELYGYVNGCNEPRTCGRNVLLAGTGYLKGYTGTKDTVELSRATPIAVHMALLHSFELHESLTDSVLAIFRPNEVSPACYSAAKVPGKKEDFYYGRWSIRSVHVLQNGNYLAWIVAGGGDGGYEWSLQRFLEVDPACRIAQQKDYLVSWGPQDGCQRALAGPSTYFSVFETGAIKVRTPKRDCNSVTLSRITTKSASK
ncbi:MAG: hypothetical protein Q7T07_00525 [Burkholderiaceae bacterium]|nr:hypothetical protein [Burkholderiaceae bacterium]